MFDTGPDAPPRHILLVYRTIGALLVFIGVTCSVIAVWLLTVSFHLGLAVVAAWTNGIIVGAGLWLMMERTPTAIHSVTAMAIGGPGFAIISGSEQVSYERRFNIWWQEPRQIERYLRSETPIGSPEQQVLNWLREHAYGQPILA